jgi:hypothetical protein
MRESRHQKCQQYFPAFRALLVDTSQLWLSILFLSLHPSFLDPDLYHESNQSQHLDQHLHRFSPLVLF